MANPYTNTDQFYSTGRSKVFLPPGTYTIKVSKGPEFEAPTREVTIAAGKTAAIEVPMKRWINPIAEGWYSADAHLHINRPFRELDPQLSRWMQGEDIHVAGLLQWGNSKRFHNAIQYAHGKGGVYREGDYLLVAGQENPRTHFLGHTITLGASSPIDFPDRYLIYRNFWEESRRQGALSGYAHGGLAFGAQTGLSLDLPCDLLSFVEVLQFGSLSTQVWYDILNTGFRMAPIAGTDYPCGKVLPGRERFYTRVAGELSLESWIEGIRKGRVFLTTGPFLTFTVEGKGIGEEVVLDGAYEATVEARVRFDPSRDDVTTLDVIRNGQLLRSVPREGDAAAIHVRFRHKGDEACWLAVRASGNKLGETRTVGTLAHTGAIYVSPEGARGMADQPRARELCTAWLARLEALERRLSEAEIPRLAQWPTRSQDGVEADTVRRDRAALLEAIEKARKYFLDRLR